MTHKNATLTDQWWGDFDFGVVDQDGNLIMFAQKGAVPRGEPR